MNSAPTARLLARSFIQNAARPSAVARFSPLLVRPFSQTPAPHDSEPKKDGHALLSAMYGTSSSSGTQSAKPSAVGSKAGLAQNLVLGTLNRAAGNKVSPEGNSLESLAQQQDDLLEPYHIHIMSHKHNCHVTVTKPNRDAIISLSTGNIGFKKSKRKTYDAAYQLMAYVLERLNYAGWQQKINNIEVVLRGFGAGREAAVKVLMAPEGKAWRGKIVRVADATRLKFGGTRSQNPRRV